MLEIKRALSEGMVWATEHYNAMNNYVIDIAVMDVDGYTHQSILHMGDWLMLSLGNPLAKLCNTNQFDNDEFFANITAKCRIYKTDSTGFPIGNQIFPIYDGNVDHWESRELIGWDVEAHEYVTNPNADDVAEDCRCDIRMLQGALKDIIGSIVGELDKNSTNALQECNKTNELSMEYIKRVRAILTRVYEEDADEDTTEAISAYIVSAPEFTGSAYQWINWICRSVLTVDGDDHTAERVIGRLCSPVTLKRVGDDDHIYWPGILREAVAEPLVDYDEATGWYINSAWTTVDIDHQNAIFLIGKLVADIINQIVKEGQ